MGTVSENDKNTVSERAQHREVKYGGRVIDAFKECREERVEGCTERREGRGKRGGVIMGGVKAAVRNSPYGGRGRKRLGNDPKRKAWNGVKQCTNVSFQQSLPRPSNSK